MRLPRLCICLIVCLSSGMSPAWSYHDGTCHDTNVVVCLMDQPFTVDGLINAGWVSRSLQTVHQPITLHLQLKQDNLLTKTEGGVRFWNYAIDQTRPSVRDPVIEINRWFLLDQLPRDFPLREDGYFMEANLPVPPVASGSFPPQPTLTVDHGGSFVLIVETKITGDLITTGNIPDQKTFYTTDKIFMSILPWCSTLKVEVRKVADPELEDNEVRPRNSEATDPTNLKSQVRIRVFNDPRVIPAGGDLALYVDMAAGSNRGGHEEGFHTSPRPLGTFTNNRMILECPIPAGSFDFTTTYTANEFSGDEQIFALVSEHPFQSLTPFPITLSQQDTARTALKQEITTQPKGTACELGGGELEDGRRVVAQISVKVPNLELLPDGGSDYVKIGGRCEHHGPRDDSQYPNCRTPDNNHWGERDVILALQDIAHQAMQPSPTGLGLTTPLKYNDISLPLGGRFDVNGNWTGDHAEHRKGQDADIRKNPPYSDGLKESLLNRFAYNVVIPIWSGAVVTIHGSGNNEHFHIDFD